MWREYLREEKKNTAITLNESLFANAGHPSQCLFFFFFWSHYHTHTGTQRCLSLSVTHTELRGWCTEWPLVNPDRFPQPPTNCHSQSLPLLSLLINIIKTLHLHMSPPGGSTLSLVVPSGPSCLSTNPWRGDALHLIISFFACDSLGRKHDICYEKLWSQSDTFSDLASDTFLFLFSIQDIVSDDVSFKFFSMCKGCKY